MNDEFGLVYREAVSADRFRSNTDEWQTAYLRALAESLRCAREIGRARPGDKPFADVVDGAVGLLPGILGIQLADERRHCGARGDAGLSDTPVGVGGGVDGDGSGSVGSERLSSDRLQSGVSRGRESVDGVGDKLGGGGDDSQPDASTGVSGRTLVNRVKREKKKKRKQRKQAASGQKQAGVGDACGIEVSEETGSAALPEWRRGAGVTPARYVAGLINADSDAELKASVKAKWIAKNKLEAAKAEREFAVLQGVDVDVAVRKQNVVMRSAIERGLVTIEKSHASLRGADVHSSDDESRVHTMLSGSSGSISPNSSVSEAELRALVARTAELEKEKIEQDKRVASLIAQLTARGGSETLAQPAPKSMWTVDEHGELAQEHQDAMFENDYSWTSGDCPPVKCADGKFRVRLNYF